MGSLAIDGSDNLFMATSDILSDLTDSKEELYPVLIISKGGDIQAYTGTYSTLGGNDFDNSDNLYQPILKSGRVIKIDKQGATSPFINDEDDVALNWNL